MIRLKSNIVFVIIILLAFTGLAVEKKNQKMCPKKPHVLIEKVKLNNFNEFKQFDLIFDFEKKEVKSNIGGVITKINVKQDELVSEGFILAEIDNALKDKIKTLDDEIKKWKRILWNRQHWKVRSPKAEKQAQDKIDKLNAEKDDLINKRDAYLIKSTLAGKISKINYEENSSLSQGDTVFVLENKSVLLSVIENNELNDSLFKVGEQIKIGEYSVLVRDKNEKEIVLAIDNKDLKYNKKLNLKFKILYKEHKNVFSITNKILINEIKKNGFVYVFKNKHIFKRNVEILINKDDIIVLKKGLNNNDLYVIGEIISLKEKKLKDNWDCLKDGLKVKAYGYDRSSNRFLKLKKIKEFTKISGKKINVVKEEKKKESKAKKSEEKEQKSEKKEETKIEKKSVVKVKYSKTGYHSFLKLLKNNKDKFNYQKLEVKEVKDKYLVSLYGPKKLYLTILNNIGNFDVKELNAKFLKCGDVVILIGFDKEAPIIEREISFKEMKKNIKVKYFKFGAYYTNYEIKDTNLAKYYEVNKSLLGYYFEIEFLYNLGFSLDFKTFLDESETTFYNNPMKFTVNMFSLGLRYYPVKLFKALSPFIGVGYNRYSLEESVESEYLQSTTGTATGFNFNLGLRLDVESFPYLELYLLYKYNAVKTTINDFEIDLGGNEFLGGLNIRF